MGEVSPIRGLKSAKLIDAVIAQMGKTIDMPSHLSTAAYDRMSQHLLGKDGHPDPLVISSAYKQPREGWWCITSSTPEELASMIVVTAYPPGVVPEYSVDISAHWWYPDEGFAREIARQIITGERAVFVSGGRDDWYPKHPVAVQLGRVVGTDMGWYMDPVAYCTNLSPIPVGNPFEPLNDIVRGVRHEPRWYNGGVVDSFLLRGRTRDDV